jgi:hypothetical protein
MNSAINFSVDGLAKGSQQHLSPLTLASAILDLIFASTDVQVESLPQFLVVSNASCHIATISMHEF